MQHKGYMGRSFFTNQTQHYPPIFHGHRHADGHSISWALGNQFIGPFYGGGGGAVSQSRVEKSHISIHIGCDHFVMSQLQRPNKEIVVGWSQTVDNLLHNSIGSDNGLSPGRSQAIIWTNAGILLVVPLGTNFYEDSIEIHTFSFKKMSSGKWRSLCPGLKVLVNRAPD